MAVSKDRINELEAVKAANRKEILALKKELNITQEGLYHAQLVSVV
jgi:hypothetical protein